MVDYVQNGDLCALDLRLRLNSFPQLLSKDSNGAAWALILTVLRGQTVISPASRGAEHIETHKLTTSNKFNTYNYSNYHHRRRNFSILSELFYFQILLHLMLDVDVSRSYILCFNASLFCAL